MNKGTSQQVKQLAHRFREVILNGTWVANTNYRDQLSQVSLEEATAKIGSLNTLAVLAFHINYYIAGVLNVFKGGELEIRDKYSFDLPPLKTEAEWQALLNTFWKNAEEFAKQVENMSNEKLDEPFTDEKYGTYRRNIEGMIEHCYCHLGQITIIRKMIKESIG